MSRTTLVRYHDRSGDLRRGYFYRIEVPFDTEMSLRMESESREWVVYDSTAMYDLQAWIEVCVGSEEQHACPLDSAHITAYENHFVEWAELYGGEWVADFVRDSIGESIVTTADFGQRLAGSSLTGLALQRFNVRFSQAGLREIPSFCRFDFRGRNCLRPVVYRPPEPNQCPCCGFGPVVCPACHEIEYVCPRCEHELVGFSDEPHDRPFSAEVINYTDFVVEADQWDGSDFFAGWYITRRALRHLMKLKAEPFVAKPVWANVERLTESQLAALEAM